MIKKSEILSQGPVYFFAKTDKIYGLINIGSFYNPGPWRVLFS